MRRIVFLICAIGSFVYGIAQTSTLAITTDKTTSLIFPFPIRHVDRGTKDVLVQQVKGVANILLLKAASSKFPETNVSVVTGDGSVYTFVVTYAEQLDVPVVHVPEQKDATIATYANGILDNPRTMRGIHDRKFEVCASVQGLYIRDATLYVQIRLSNQSSIDYDVDQLTFLIRDKKKSKRTAVQENELTPLHISGNAKLVKAHDVSSFVVALDKFTIPDAKLFLIQLMEKNGGRHLRLKLRNNQLVRSIILPALR
jgi:conjugative transposon TraN protein